MMQVMDASALLALVRGEPGSDVVLDLLGSQECVASSVNMAELGSKLIDLGLPQAELERALRQFDVDVIDFNHEQAALSAALRQPTKPMHLTLGDRACLALAKQLDAVAVTADSAWLDVQQAEGVRVLLIR